MAGTEFTVDALASTKIGDIRTENGAVAQFLERMKDEYRLSAYFRGFDLRVGVLVYLEREAVTRVFKFQHNIISDELTYQRRDDVQLSAVAYSVNEVNVNKTTKDGKSKSERLECFVYAENGSF